MLGNRRGHRDAVLTGHQEQVPRFFKEAQEGWRRVELGQKLARRLLDCCSHYTVIIYILKNCCSARVVSRLRTTSSPSPYPPSLPTMNTNQVSHIRVGNEK